jgi:hypothetical protein
MTLKTILAIATMVIFSASANAQTTTTAKHVSTIKNDRQRIKQGVKSGELNKAETARLREQTKDLAQERKAYKLDGISTEERKDLRKDKKQLSRRIYRQKHDGQTR